MHGKFPAITISSRTYGAVIFDLNGVVSKTMDVYRTAWKILFDDYLKHGVVGPGVAFQPFDADADYRFYVDGKPRYEGATGAADALKQNGADLLEERSND